MKKICAVLIGNPNVGKSTLFNALTGLKQHTGNWTGKTVENAIGYCEYQDCQIEFIDLPGTYSLQAYSYEEQVATDYILKRKYDIAVVVCDSVCLAKSLPLVLQTLEITDKVIVCLNLIDEASKKGIIIDSYHLSEELDVPIIVTDARNKVGLQKLLEQIIHFKTGSSYLVKYDEVIEKKLTNKNRLERYEALQILEKNDEQLKNKIVNQLVNKSNRLFSKYVKFTNEAYDAKDRKIDKILTSKLTGIPVMLLLLFAILWLTIIGSNYPSAWLFQFFGGVQKFLSSCFHFLCFPEFLHDFLILGVFKTLFWVVSVMLPPMLIFFPLFTILEDYGFLPRIAFNVDHLFSKCNACGKQCLTMLMGFGCNAVGVTGTRIIDSKRERLLAILTNVFVPCNGRFPTIIAVISIFFIGTVSSIFYSVLSAFILTLVLLSGILMTFFVSKILSKTILKGYSSGFILELPPYRRPKFKEVLIRSLVDRTLFILGKAVMVAIPAGAILYLFSHIMIGDVSILQRFANLFQGVGTFIGLDGMILVAFLLGFPANEIVIPILLMGYLATGSLVDYESIYELKSIFVSNGWTLLTGINFLILTLFHFPCSTTFLTIKKETGSWKWSVFALVLPTLIGIFLCICTTFLWHLFL